MSLKGVIQPDVILLNNCDHQDSIHCFAGETKNGTSVFSLAVGMISTKESLYSAYNYIFISTVTSGTMWNEFQLLDTA